MKFLGFFVKRTMLVNLMGAFLIIVGLYTATTLRREAFPAINVNWVFVTTIYPGASPEEVEKLVSRPIENALSAVDGLKRVVAVSVEGRSEFWIEIEADADDPDKVLRRIEREVGLVDDLPEDAEEPLVTEFSPYFPVIIVSVSSDTRSDIEIRRTAKEIQDRLEDIQGVGQVAPMGLKDEEIWVEADPRKLDQYAVSLPALVEALAQQNVQLPGGRIETAHKEILVRTLGEFEDAGSVGDVVVRSNDEGFRVRVRDLAKVTPRLADTRQIYRVNGINAVALQVQKKKTGDSLDIGDEVKRQVKILEKEFPDYRFSLHDDSTFYIKRRLNVALNNAGFGMALILIILTLLMDPVIAAMTALGIAVAVFIGIWLAALFGMTINLLTLFGFVIVAGILVDDNVVVGESIFSMRQKGMKPEEGATLGVARVTAPVLASVATTIASFLPLIFMAGIMGKFMKYIPAIVIFCLIGSLWEALFIYPNHLCHTWHWSKLRIFEGITRFQQRHVYPRFEALKGFQMKWFKRAVARPWITVGAAFGVLVLLVGLAGGLLRFKLFPGEIEEFMVMYELPIGTSLSDSNEVARKVEEVILDLPPQEVDVAISQVGVKGEEDDQRRGSHLGQIRVVLTQAYEPGPVKWILHKLTGRSVTERTRRAGEIEKETREKVEALSIPGVKWEVRGRRTGPPQGKPISVVLLGDDLKELQAISAKVQEMLKGYEGVRDIGDNWEEGKEEIHVRVDEQKAARAGMTVRDVAAAVRGVLDGLEATEIKKGSDEIVVRVRYDTALTTDPAVLDRVRVVTPRGYRVPLSQLARLEKGRGTLAIIREDSKIAITVGAEVDDKVTTSREVNQALVGPLTELLAAYPTSTFKLTGENEDTQESIDSLMKLFGVAVLIIFIILATQFNSLSQPLIIMAAIPLGFIGVMVTHLTHGMAISMLSMLGTVALAGVVVNNAILLIEFANRALEEGKTPEQAVLQAADQRFRAIFITSLTTVAGLLPLGYGIGGREPFLEPMALVLGWGVAVSSFFTLYVVPCLWLIVARITGLGKKPEGPKPALRSRVVE